MEGIVEDGVGPDVRISGRPGAGSLVVPEDLAEAAVSKKPMTAALVSGASLAVAAFAEAPVAEHAPAETVITKAAVSVPDGVDGEVTFIKGTHAEAQVDSLK